MKVVCNLTNCLLVKFEQIINRVDALVDQFEYIFIGNSHLIDILKKECGVFCRYNHTPPTKILS